MNIFSAIESGRTSMVRAMLEADPSLVHARYFQTDDQPLNTAAYHGRVSIARMLLQAGADINNRGIHGFTPLNDALKSKSSKMIKLLLERGANINVQDDSGETPYVRAAVQSERRTIPEAMRGRFPRIGDPYLNLFIAAGSPPTALSKYVLDGEDAALAHLRESGLPADQRELQWLLRSCALDGSERLLSWVFDQGVPADGVDSAQPLLIDAIQGEMFDGDNLSTIQLLVDRGANVGWCDPDGHGYLYLFYAGQARAETRELLERHGATP